jgi:aldose 1-epimerase
VRTYHKHIPGLEVGRVIELAAEGVTATIDAARGGRLASLRVGAEELLVGPWDDRDVSIRWGCYLMAPWAGRLADARLAWRGRTIQLERNHGRHAIHGLVTGAPWEVDRADSATAELSISLDRGGWPFGGVVRQRFALGPGWLVMEAKVVAGEQAMPAALGWHPWFARRGDPSLRVDADHVLESRGMIPTGRLVPVAGKLDLRAGPRLGRRRLDDPYVGVRPPVELTWPDDLTVRIRTEPWLSTVVVYSPSGAVCVEPQSAWPNLGEGTSTLEPGASLRASLALAWTRPG